jgi:hypothetical protein
MRKSGAKRFRFQCIHPPGPNYNQYDGEGGIYLGPQPEPQNFSYNPKGVSSDTTRLANYFYCYPSYEDEYHIRLIYCEKQSKHPTCPKGEWNEMCIKAKQEIK